MFTTLHRMQSVCQASFARHAMEEIPQIVHTMHMEQKRHYLKEWREYRDKTLERVGEELEALAQEPRFQNDKHAQNQGKTYSTLHRVETGKVPYSQALLEMLAEIYQTDTGSLITVNPMIEDTDRELKEIWGKVPEADRATAIRVLRSFAGRTGTDG